MKQENILDEGAGKLLKEHRLCMQGAMDLISRTTCFPKH